MVYDLVQPVSDEARAAIERVLKERLAGMGLQSVDIRAGRDHDGDPVLYIDAHHAYSKQPIDTRPTFGLIAVLRQELEKIGERRFPHLRHKFDERQKVAGW